MFRIAGVQMASGPNVAANLNEAKRLIEMAVEQGAKLVALPEYFAIMGLKDTDKVEAREKEGKGPIQRFLAETARHHKIWLIGCSVPLESAVDGKVYNSMLAYDDGGRQVARYDKIHLFSLRPGQGEVQRAAHHPAGPGRQGARLAVRPHRAVGVLRPALPGAVPGHAGRGHHRGARRVHRDHRARALGDADPCPRHREPGLRPGARRRAATT